MSVQQTSLEAYHIFRQAGSFNRQESEILQVLKQYPGGLSYQQINERSRITINAVCGRMNDLKRKDAIIEDGSLINPYTGVRNKIWRLKNMVDATKVYESNWVNIDRVKTSPTKIGVILGEGSIEKGFRERDQLVLPIEMDSNHLEYGLNKTSHTNLSAQWGADSKLWIGKRIRFTVMKVNNTDSLVSIPLIDELKTTTPAVAQTETETIKIAGDVPA